VGDGPAASPGGGRNGSGSAPDGARPETPEDEDEDEDEEPAQHEEAV
jgi:hypothetical protein